MPLPKRGGFKILVPKYRPADFQRTRKLTEEEVESEVPDDFQDEYPSALWHVVEFSYDKGKTWEWVSVFPLTLGKK